MHASPPMFSLGPTGNQISFALKQSPGKQPYDFGLFNVTVHAGKFSGSASCYLNRNDFSSLLIALERMDTFLIGSHKFEPIEGQIILKIEMQKLGGVDIEGDLFEQSGGWGNSLKFSIGLDQTFLKSTKRELADFIASFDQ